MINHSVPLIDCTVSCCHQLAEFDLYSSSNDPFPWSWRAKVVFTSGDLISAKALNSPTTLQRVKIKMMQN